jgi:hypothetical protein
MEAASSHPELPNAHRLTSNLGGGAGGSTGGGAVGGTGGGTAAGGVGLQAIVLLDRVVSDITIGSWWWHWRRSCRRNRRRLCKSVHEGDKMSTDVYNRLVVEPVEDQLVAQAVEVQVVVSSHIPLLLRSDVDKFIGTGGGAVGGTGSPDDPSTKRDVGQDDVHHAACASIVSRQTTTDSTGDSSGGGGSAGGGMFQSIFQC